MVNTNIIEQNQFHRVWVPLMLTLLWLVGLIFAFDGMAFTDMFSDKIPKVWVDVFPIFVLMALSVVVLINDIIRTYPPHALTDKRIHHLYVLFMFIFILAVVFMVVLSVTPTSSVTTGIIIILGAFQQFMYNFVQNNLNKYLVSYNPPIEASAESATAVLTQG